MTDKELTARFTRLDEAIGSLAELVTRHAPIQWQAHPELANIAAECRERLEARERRRDEQLREIDAKRQEIERVRT